MTQTLPSHSLITLDSQLAHRDPDCQTDSAEVAAALEPPPSSTVVIPHEQVQDPRLVEPTEPAYPAQHPNSRLWTISCNHPGYSSSMLECERQPKKRRIVEAERKPQWLTKIVLLGGCNSTMSTVRTIFRHIQPFSVVTGVTVVRDNLSLNLAAKGDHDWEDSGSLAQLCYGCAATTAGTKAYVFGGKDANSQYLAHFQEFDLVTNTSRMLPKGPQPKENAVAVRIGL